MSRFITTDANGYKLIAAFDVAQNEVGKEINGIQIRHVDELEAFCAEHHPKVAVLCVPRDGAEQARKAVIDAMNAGTVPSRSAAVWWTWASRASGTSPTTTSPFPTPMW